MITRELVDNYLDKRLSRRGFIGSLAKLGFSAAAATSILESLAPLVQAAAPDAGPAMDRLRAVLAEGTGGSLLVEQLHAAGVRFVFNCNSSRTSPIFDALVDKPDMQVITVPQEGQMIAIAQGYTLGSGQIAFTVSGGVGFPNTLNNMYNAWKDRTPIVVGSEREPSKLHGGRDAFEEWDDFLSPSTAFTRWRWSVEQAERVPEFTRRAFKIASTQPQGPVALAFPVDMLSAPGKAAIIDRDKFIIKPQIKAAPSQVEEAAKLLIEAKNPLLVVGPEVTRSEAKLEIIKLAEQLSIPVTQGERLFDDFPTDHPLFLGDFRGPVLFPADADLVLNLGSRMPARDGVMPSGATVIHVSIDPDNIGRVVPTDLGIVADVKEAASDLWAAVESAAPAARIDEIRAARLDATRQVSADLWARRAQVARERWDNNPMSWERVAGELNLLLEKDAILVPEVDHGGYLGLGANGALCQFAFSPGGKSKIGKTTGSALGWGIGAAMGVKLAQPNRQVVSLQGDGGFMFAQAETLWTMARYEIPVIIVIFNNRSYNGPRDRIMQGGGRQAKAGKDMICYLGNPDVDFAKVAAGFGVKGEVVQAPDQLKAAIQRAIESTRNGQPYLIDAVVERTGLAADSTWYPKYSVAAARNRKV